MITDKYEVTINDSIFYICSLNKSICEEISKWMELNQFISTKTTISFFNIIEEKDMPFSFYRPNHAINKFTAN